MSIYNHLSLRGILKKPEQFVVFFFFKLKLKKNLLGTYPGVGAFEITGCVTWYPCCPSTGVYGGGADILRLFKTA